MSLIQNNNITLSYSLYDWDDNILHMDTKIIMEHFVDDKWVETYVSTTDFTVLRKDPNYRIPLKNDGSMDFNKAYSNFRDDPSDTIFLTDVIDAINNKKFAPSYESFKKCLINGNLFFLITARGHEPNTIKRAIEYFIETQLNNNEKSEMLKNLSYYIELFNEQNIDNNKLLENYLSLCEYIGVSSKYYKEKFKYDENENVEKLKKIAIEYIVEKLKKYRYDNCKIKIGFSDDDVHNLNAITEFFKTDLKHKNEDIDFYIFDTSKNPDNSKNYTKTKL